MPSAIGEHQPALSRAAMSADPASIAESDSLSIRVWDASDPVDRAAWLQAWSDWPDREVFAHPAYGALFARRHDRVCCAAWGDAGGGILFPFVLRPLAVEPWAEPDEATWDLVSPYGYGGPFAWNVPPRIAPKFWDAFDEWLASHRVIATTVRLSLFASQRMPIRGEVHPVLPNVIRRLDLDEPSLWRDYEYKVRKNVQRARADGLTVEILETGRSLDEFLAIYYATMDRRHASDAYYFPRAFFESLVDQLPGQFRFVHVRSGERIVSTELVLVSRRYVYSFLGGTLPDAFPSRPNDLLKHEVIRWAQQSGMSAFVLGGGHQGEDGIFRYKRSFAPHGVEPFCLGRRVLALDHYERLVVAKDAWRRRQSSTSDVRPDFFPAYRA